MYYVTTERERLVEFLPNGAVAAEIGVAQGDFAAVMLEKCAPTKLHLIDPWRGYEIGGDDGARGRFLAAAVEERSAAAPPPTLHTSAEDDQKFQAVQDRFKGDARVQFHRTYSYRAAAALPDKHFDFVYLDGDHTYEYVLRDLLDYSAKIKDDGLILGHDYFEDAFAAKENYAVISAVNAFLARSGFIFVALTWEPFPTYALARRFEGFAAAFVRNLLESDVFAVDLPTSLAFGYREFSYQRRDGSQRRIPSFTRI
jgi:hypothetical protein